MEKTIKNPAFTMLYFHGFASSGASGTVETLPIAIYSMTRKKVSPEIYALSTIMFVVILAIILVSNAMESRNYRRDQRALREEGV